MSTVERPLTPEIRRALLAAQRHRRLIATATTLLGRTVSVGFKIVGLVLVAVGVVWLALGVARSNLTGELAIPLALVGFGLMALWERASGQLRRRVREAGDEIVSRIDRDLEGGVYLESVGDVAVRASREDTSAGEHVHQLDLPDRTIAVYDPSGAFALLESDGPFHGATVRYTPNAEIVLDIVTSDGRVLYRGAALDGR